MLENLKKTDPEIYEVVMKELNRQRNNLEMIASENFVSEAVLETAGTVMTNKYAEGYPNKRYYGGNQFIDISEDIARERAKQLFGAEHANVQPNAGSPANMAAYFSLLNPGDKILGMSLAHGGHLTHGSPVNFSGKLFNIVAYGVNEDTGRIDYDVVRDIARREKPNLVLAGATAYSRIIDFNEFKNIADEIGAYFMVDMAHIAGLVAADVHPSPVPYADIVTTTTHKTLRGPRGAIILCKKEHAEKVDKTVFPGLQGGPLEHIIAAKAVCFKEAMTEEFREYARQIVRNSRALADELMALGVDIVSGGTDNHLMLVNLTNKNITGKEAQHTLEEALITVNKNMVPGDTRSPFVTSGIRVGTAALTTRGMKEEEMRTIAGLIVKVLDNINDEAVKDDVRDDVLELCRQNPLYPKMISCL